MPAGGGRHGPTTETPPRSHAAYWQRVAAVKTALESAEPVTSPGPAATVVIPVWGPRYVASLARAITSVRAQDADVPIIVADNASEVEVPEAPGTIVVRSRRRLSVGEARNLGLERVETEYVVILDADDELIPGALASLRAGIDADPSIAVYAMSLLDAETGARHRTPRRFVPALTRVRRLFAAATTWSLYPIHGSAIMRTSWVRDAGGTSTAAVRTGCWRCRWPFVGA